MRAILARTRYVSTILGRVHQLTLVPGTAVRRLIGTRRLRKKPSESTFHGHQCFVFLAVVNVMVRQVVMVMAGTRPKMKSFFGCHHAKVGFIKLRTSYVIWTLSHVI